MIRRIDSFRTVVSSGQGTESNQFGESTVLMVDVLTRFVALKRAKMAKIMAQQKEADNQPALTPEVKWAQNPEAISLTVGLGQMLRPEIKINGNTLEFFASGVGARNGFLQFLLGYFLPCELFWKFSKSGSRRNYEFELEFYDHVDRGFAMRVGPSTVQLLVRKDRETCYMWKSLTKGPKPNFLKIDTERWIDPDEIQFRSPEEMEKLRLQQLSQQERSIEERYKQILNEEGKTPFDYIYKTTFQMFDTNQPKLIENWPNVAICLLIPFQCSVATFSSFASYYGDL